MECGRCIPQLPVGRRRQVAGLPRQSVSNVSAQFYPIFREKPSKITTLSKISDTSTDIYDILKPALATQSLAVPRFGRLTLSPNHHNRILRMPKYSITEIERKYYIFFSPIFMLTSIDIMRNETGVFYCLLHQQARELHCAIICRRAANRDGVLQQHPVICP